jgi:nitronate monooxygenase
MPATRLPVFSAPMFLVSGPELVIAACRAGIVGAFPTPNARTGAMLEEWMQRITTALDAERTARPGGTIGPWCVNLITHSSNTRLPEDLALVAKYRPPVVVTALGSPKPAVPVVHDYGGIVIADVINLSLARKAIAAGVDGLACVSAGAGGHTGFLSPFAFIAAVRAMFDGLIVIGGGLADGRAVAGAITAGADFVYMGTGFIATEESLAVPAYKQMIVDSSLDDLIVTAAITGTPASWLKPSLRAAGIDPDALPDKPERNYDSGSGGASRWRDLWAAGQGVGAIHAIEPVAVVVDRIEREYREALAASAGRLAAGAGRHT